HDVVDRADPLAGRIALAVGVDVARVVTEREVQGAGPERDPDLLRERPELPGMLLVVPRRLVAHDAHRLAAERAAHDRSVLVGREQLVLVAGDGPGLRCRDEARPDPHAVGPE